MIGDEVGGGEQNRVLCLIDGRNVEIANRKSRTHGFILADGKQRVELVRIPLRDLLVDGTEAIPEPDEGSRQFCCSRAAYRQMRVAPLGGIQRTQVVAPDEAGGAIGDQDLAMIQGVPAQVQQVPGTTNATVFQHMDRRMKGGLEGAWDDEIAKAVKDDIDGNSLLGFSRKMLLKFLSNRIRFPDIGLQINTLVCRIDGLEHRIVEITSVAYS